MRVPCASRQLQFQAGVRKGDGALPKKVTRPLETSVLYISCADIRDVSPREGEPASGTLPPVGEDSRGRSGPVSSAEGANMTDESIRNLKGAERDHSCGEAETHLPSSTRDDSATLPIAREKVP